MNELANLNLIPQEEILTHNMKIDYQLPVIGYCPDWRIKINENE